MDNSTVIGAWNELYKSVCVCMRVIVCERQNLILILFDFIKIVAHTQREKTLAKNTHPLPVFCFSLARYGRDSGRGLCFRSCYDKISWWERGGYGKEFSHPHFVTHLFECFSQFCSHSFSFSFPSLPPWEISVVDGVCHGWHHQNLE